MEPQIPLRKAPGIARGWIFRPMFQRFLFFRSHSKHDRLQLAVVPVELGKLATLMLTMVMSPRQYILEIH